MREMKRPIRAFIVVALLFLVALLAAAACEEDDKEPEVDAGHDADCGCEEEKQ